MSTIKINFNAVANAWLRSDPADRDLSQGALYILQIDRNQTAYAARMRNLKAYAQEIEQTLRDHITVREKTPTPEQAKQIRAEARQLLQEIAPLKEDNPAAQFKSGKRADHDTLPTDIQQLYADNLELRHKMQQLHLEIRQLLKKKTACASSDLRDLCQLMRKTDTQYHDNWKQYDEYTTDPAT